MYFLASVLHSEEIETFHTKEINSLTFKALSFGSLAENKHTSAAQLK